MNGLPLFDQRSNNAVDSPKLGRLSSKSLPAFTADSLVLTLSKLGIVEMPSEFTVASFFTSVADIRWLAEFQTYHLLKVLADSKALDLIALPTELSEFLLTWIADVRKMLALPTMAARIKGFFFYDLVVTSYLFGDSRRILIYFLGDLLERHAFSEAGFDNPMFSTVLVGVVNMVTTILAVFIIDRVGRKQLIYWGVSGMIICLLAIGIYFAWGSQIGLGNGFMLTFFLAYVFCCAISISAIVFVLLSEMYPNSVRGRAMSIAGFALWIGTYLIGQLTPVLLGWSQAGTFFIFAACCVPYMLIMWKVVPETTGKTLEEIEDYWNNYKK